MSKTLRRLRIRYEPFGVRRQLSEHRLAYILWRYLGRWFRACRPLRASAKKQLREKAAAGLRSATASDLAYTVDHQKVACRVAPYPFTGGNEKPAGVNRGWAASPLLVRMDPDVRRDFPRLRQLDHVRRRLGADVRPDWQRDYHPKPTAVGSVFWPCGVINPVLGLFVSPTGNSVAIAGSAQRGRTVWIAVVRMQMDHADSTAMGSDDRLMMICGCKRERAEEREPRG
jgi:hypothetical protein